MTTTPVTDYIPEDEWPAVSEMLEGFGEQTLPASPALAGTEITFHGDDGSSTRYEFATADRVTWHETGGDAPEEHESAYKAIEVRDGIFIVDIVEGEGLSSRNITMVYDRTSGAATTGISTFVRRADEVRSDTRFIHSRTSGASSDAEHPRSSGLVGKRIYYRYSDVESYEHIYLSPGTYTWHCVRGGEAGLADTEKCMAFDVAEDLYLFFWTEKVMTVEAVLLIDLRGSRSVGRMFGWDSPTSQPVVLPFNSRLSVLNTTEYPTDHQKH